MSETNTHIIEISPELEKRVALRRATDLADRTKAERYDAIVKKSRFYFDLWIQQHALSVMLANGSRQDRRNNG